MNREQKRLKAKAEPKRASKKALEKWIKSLNKSQLDMINQYMAIEHDKRFNKATQSLDCAFTASMVIHTDIRLDDINNIFEEVFKLMKDDTEKEKYLKRNKNEKEYDELMKNAAENINKEALEMFRAGKKQKDIRDVMIINNPLLSKAKITNAVKKVKEQFEKELAELEVQQAAEKIMNIIEPKEIKEIKEIKDVSTNEIEKATAQVGKSLIEVKKAFDKSKQDEIKKGPIDGIKVRKIEAVGRFAHYIAESKRVKFKLDRSFDRNTWEALKSEVEAMFTMMEGK